MMQYFFHMAGSGLHVANIFICTGVCEKLLKMFTRTKQREEKLKMFVGGERGNYV